MIVCSDVGDQPVGSQFFGGAAAVAVLVGAEAPVKIEPAHITRSFHRFAVSKPGSGREWTSMVPLLDERRFANADLATLSASYHAMIE
eukprot:1658976-Prymnesium_polylepis.1